MSSTTRNNSEVEDVDLDEIPPIAAPVLSIVIIYTAITVGFGDLMINLAVGGAGVALFAAFAVKVGALYKQRGAMKAVDYAITPPADRTDDYSIDLTTSSGIEETEKGITLEHLQQIDPYEFEEFVAKVWRNMGYEAEVTQSSQDKGVDVVAEKSEPYNEKIYIQVKRHDEGNKVGARTVRTCSGLKQKNGVDKVVIATSSYFTSQAKEEAEDYNLKTINGEKLLELYQNNVE